MTMPSQSRIKTVVAQIAGETGLPADAIRTAYSYGGRAKKPLIEAKWRAWRALADQGFTLSGIGKAWGCDHTSVMHGLRRLREAA